MSLITAGWAFWYAIYRAYYGFGGTVGMFGTPVSEAQWRGINLAGAALLLGVAVLPVAVLPLWRMPRRDPFSWGCAGYWPSVFSCTQSSTTSNAYLA